MKRRRKTNILNRCYNQTNRRASEKGRISNGRYYLVVFTQGVK